MVPFPAIIQSSYQSVAALVPQEEEEAAKDLPQHCRALEWGLRLAEYRIGLWLRVCMYTTNLLTLLTNLRVHASFISISFLVYF